MGTWQVTEVQRYLKGASYPESGRELARLAERNGADDDLVEALSSIDRRLDGPNEAMKELAGDLGGPPPGPTQDRGPRDDVEGPAFQVDDVQRHLAGADYPASGEDLASLARSNGAPDELVDVLRDVDRADSVTDVMEQLQPHLGGPESS